MARRRRPLARAKRVFIACLSLVPGAPVRSSQLWHSAQRARSHTSTLVDNTSHVLPVQSPEDNFPEQLSQEQKICGN
jgi:hypothetical protein